MTMDAVRENQQLSRWAALLPRSPRQRGAVHETDAELVPLGDGDLLALTVDAVAEEIRAGLYRDPFTAGRIAATASLSDLAAVGAEPLGLLLAACLPEQDAERVQARVAAGVAEVCREAGTFVLGGDTSQGPALWLSVTAAGRVPEREVLTRVGARAGDALYASGPLGAGAALAASRLLGVPGLTEDEFRPPLRLAHGRALRGIASACIDTSDGLVAALDQLARLNGVAVRVDQAPEALLHPAAERARAGAGLPAFPFLASHHGEFELVFTVPPERQAELDRRAAAMGWAPLRLGAIAAGGGLSLAGRPVDGARVRNLLAEVGGDVQAYVRALCAM